MPIVRTRRHAAPIAAAIAILAVAPAPIFAQPAQPEQPAQPSDPGSEKAQQLFIEGREAVKKGEYARAFELFSKSQEIHPAPGTMLNVASCEEQLGRTASAWQHFSLVMSQVPEGDDRLPIAKEGVARVAPRVPYLRIDRAAGAPQDLKIKRGDSLLAAASLSVDLPLDPGSYVVTTEASGHEPRRYEIKLTEGQRLPLVVDAGPAVAQVVAPPPPPPPKVSPLRPLGFTLIGVGVSGIAVGAVTGVLAVTKKNELGKACPIPAKCTPDGLAIAGTGKAFAGVSTASFIFGVAAAGVGTILYFTTAEKAEPAPKAAILPAVGPDGAGVVATGRF